MRCARDLALGPSGCAELRSLVRPFGIALAKELSPWTVGSLVEEN